MYDVVDFYVDYLLLLMVIMMVIMMVYGGYFFWNIVVHMKWLMLVVNVGG